MSEPSKWAKAAEVELARHKPIDYPRIIQTAIDQACAQKDAEIERLAADVNSLNNLLRSVGWGQGEIDSSATIAEESEAKDQRIAQMAALLDEMEHSIVCENIARGTDCPACAWEKMKAEQMTP